MLAHPADEDVVTPVLRAAAAFEVRFAGHSAHSAMAPESGRNALDAAILSYQAMGAARSTLAVGDHLSVVLTEGGIAPNVIPANSTLKVMIRARHSSRLPTLLALVHRCCAAGAGAARCRYRLRATGPTYRELRHHHPLAEAFTCNARRLGRTMRPGGPERVARAGSSDLGNVSQLAPTIHPKLAIAGSGTAQHTKEFAAAAISERADLAVLDGAKAMAMTALDVWSRPITHDRRGTC